MDIDGHLMSLGVEAERQHQIISQWEARRTKLYTRSGRPNTSAGRYLHTFMRNVSYAKRRKLV